MTLRNIVIVMLAVVAMSTNTRRLRGNVLAPDCVPRLDGGVFPYLVPEYSVWTNFFDRLQVAKKLGVLNELRSELELTESAMDFIVSVSTEGLNRAAALKASAFPPSGIPQKTAAADMILETRDDLLRSLAPSDGQRLIEHIDRHRRLTRYAFERPGRNIAETSQRFNCPISINGKVDPELIPEAYYWEFHMRVLASISEKQRVGPDKYDADYIEALRQQRLPIPEKDVILVLKTAVEMTAQVDAVRDAQSFLGAAGSEIEATVAQTVQAARLGLLRNLPKSSWIVVQRDAANRRPGISYDFPTSF